MVIRDEAAPSKGLECRWCADPVPTAGLVMNKPMSAVVPEKGAPIMYTKVWLGPI